MGRSPKDKSKGNAFHYKRKSNYVALLLSSGTMIAIANRVQFINSPLREELGLPYRKRARRYGTMVHFIHLGTQLWQNDWLIYKSQE